MRVVIVSELPLFRGGVAAALAAQPTITVVGQGATAYDAKHLAIKLEPDLMLLGCRTATGLVETIQAVIGGCERARIVYLVGHADTQQIPEALRAGARGCLNEAASGPELIACIKAVHAGELYVSPTLAFHMLGKSRSRPEAMEGLPPREPLSPREEEILRQVSVGCSNKEIARALNLSDKTVKRHMTFILKKLRARNRLEAVLIAFRASPPAPQRRA